MRRKDPAGSGRLPDVWGDFGSGEGGEVWVGGEGREERGSGEGGREKDNEREIKRAARMPPHKTKRALGTPDKQN